MMIREVPGWQSGFIGAKATNYDTFGWVTGPTTERGSFWQGIGVYGVPFKASNRERLDYAGRTLFEYDPKPLSLGNRLRLLVQPNRNNQLFLFTNWAGGKEPSAEDPSQYSCDSQSQAIPHDKCQPSSGMPGQGVAIYGHKNREGTWFSVPTEAQKCDPTRDHSICGYYIEYEEPSGERPVKFAHQTTLDMGRFREFCQSSGAPTS